MQISVLLVLLFGLSFKCLHSTAASVSSLALNKTCTTPAGNPGRCVPVRSCNFVSGMLRKPNPTLADHRYLEKFYCGKVPGSGKILVCCPQLHSEEPCGRVTMQDYILGGQETEPDEFPWVAVLAYRDFRNRTSYFCGGTLINKRYVVTAAHCITVSKVRKLVAVRLGEWDLDTTEDCTTTQCFKDFQDDYSIEKIIVHEGYSSNRQSNKVHDIALIKLVGTAERTRLVAPICIPTREMVNSLNVLGKSFDVSGWGITDNGFSSRRKMKVTLPGQDMAMCNAVFVGLDASFTDDQLCVGGVHGKDSCRGDSGGPLMELLQNRWYLVGIVSIGSKNCGTKGVPGVYTRLGSYLDWMAGKIELEGRLDQWKHTW